jgi:hypothetical protein
MPFTVPCRVALAVAACPYRLALATPRMADEIKIVLNRLPLLVPLPFLD